MPERPHQKGMRWSIVLAGGEGTRLSEFIRRWLGRPRPKQYCAFTGRKTMLEHTLLRAGQLVARERILTVIGPGHRRYINGEASLSGHVLEQPANLDTAPGIFFPLAHILRADPDATVLIFPSDHFIAPTGCFLDHARRAAELAEKLRDFVILLGAVPDRPEPEFGWIQTPCLAGNFGVAQVSGFTEKPGAQAARSLYERGALWNTMIMAVKAKALWALGQSCVPGMMPHLEALKKAIGTSREAAAVASAYAAMKPCNFSKAVLERSHGRTAVLAMQGVLWNDWGRPERICETLAKTENQPAFPLPLASQFATA